MGMAVNVFVELVDCPYVFEPFYYSEYLGDDGRWEELGIRSNLSSLRELISEKFGEEYLSQAYGRLLSEFPKVYKRNFGVNRIDSNYKVVVRPLNLDERLFLESKVGSEFNPEKILYHMYR